MTESLSSQRRGRILLVEDNEDDVWLTKRAFERINAAIDLHVAYDGVDALRFLRGEHPHADAPAPDLILLDLNMPRMDGRQLLVELKKDGKLCEIPAIVLSTSAFEHDVRNAYREHAAAYMTKPLYLPENTRRTQCLLDFWLSDVAVVPSSVQC